MRARAKAISGAALCQIFGYRRLRHFGRWINVVAHGDGLGDDWNTNGESMVFESIIQSGETGAMLEIGAHDGSHTLLMLQAMRRLRSEASHIHSFEPSSRNAAENLSRLGRAGVSGEVTVNVMACSEASGEASLRCRDALGGGTNSLHDTDLAIGDGQHREHVPTITVDEYCERSGIHSILFLKVDTEGHDLHVLTGARRLLERNAIKFIQFEYNATWIAARRFLRDAFQMLQEKGYRIGKVHKDFVEEFASWDYRLEWFEHTNYVAWVGTAQPPFPHRLTNVYLAHNRP